MDLCWTLSRPNVEAALSHALEYKVAVMCAPAGFGKRTALMKWSRLLQESGTSVSWIDLETEEDPVRSLKEARSCKSGGVTILEGFESLLDSPVAGSLVHLALKIPDGCTVLVSTVVPRYGDIGLVPFMNCLIIDKETLVFSREEVEQLYDVRDTPASLRRTGYLIEQYEGWPFFVFAEFSPISAGLPAHRKDEQRDAYLEGLVRVIQDDERFFLEGIRILDSLKVDLCFEVLEKAMSTEEMKDVMRRLERRGLMRSLRHDRWLLYPPVRTYLIEHCGVQKTLDARMKSRIALEWYMQHGMHEEAARQAVMMVEPTDLLSITRDLLSSDVRLDEELALQVASRPLPWLSQSPNACIAVALAYLFAGDGASAVFWTEKLRKACDAMEDDPLQASFRECAPYLEQKARSHLCESDVSVAIGEDLLASAESLKATAESYVRHTLGEALEHQGRLEEAREQYESALAMAISASSPMLLAYVFYDLAWLLMRMGLQSEAEVKCQEGLQLCPHHLPVFVGLQSLAAFIQIERDESPNLSFVESESVKLVSAANNPDLYLDVNVVRARAAFMNGDSQTALSVVAGALSEVHGMRVPRGAMVPALAERAMLALARNSLSEAQAVRARLERMIEDDELVSLLYLHASEARIAIYEGDVDAAKLAADRMLGLSEQMGASRYELQARIFLASIAATGEDAALVEGHLREALRCCRGERAVYPFLEHRGVLRPHLFALASSRKLNYADLKHAKRILAAFERASQGDYAATGNDNEGILTRKEQEVLFLLSLGYSRQEMADALVVSINTVKTHLVQIYAKLDAHDRGEAVKEARSLGLIH